MKLIQINKEHYIVVDDSEIKEGDWIIDIKHPLSLRQIKTKHLLEDLFDSEKKITHSTLPLEKFTYDNLSDEVFSMDYHNIKPISLQEVKELIGEVDAEKKYTEEDMFRMLCLGNKLEKTNFDDENFSVFFNMFKKHIQSLQPKTEWDVEIVDGKLKLK